MRSLTLRFWLISLLTLSLSRLLLAVWLWPRIEDSGGLWPLLFGGLRIDLCLLAMIAVIPAIMAPWLGQSRRASALCGWWFRIWWLVLVLMEVATPQFILEYDIRPNRLFFEYLVYPLEVMSMLWEGYRGVLVAAAMAMALAIWMSRYLFPLQAVDRPWPVWGRAVASVAIFLACVLMARGTLDHRPINPAMVAYSDDSLVNSLALNSLYSTAYALYQFRHEDDAAEQYGSLPFEEIIHQIRLEAGLHRIPELEKYPSLHFQQASRAPRAHNLVVIVEESLGAQYVGSLGGAGLTPELDALAETGWWFERLYATGTRSVRGLEALTTGFLPTPARAVLKLPRAQSGFFTLASLLADYGYHSRFVYGGESHFDNMKGFFLGNGFSDVHDLPEFRDPLFVGSWGASDEDMFNELHRLLSEDRGPTYTLAFSVSNHSPWEYPQGRIQAEGDPASVENAIRYADWALGEFFRKARQSDYWHNTVFLVVADHDARVRGASAVPVARFHIPALIVGADIEISKDRRLASQVDLPPTLLSLLGISAFHPMLGQDLTQATPDRAVMQYGNVFGYMEGDQLLVLRPSEEPEQFTVVNGSELLPAAVDIALQTEALAHALWSSVAYERGLYPALTQQHIRNLLLQAQGGAAAHAGMVTGDGGA